MPETQAVVLSVSNEHPGFIRADAGYFGKRAKQCFRLADKASDADAVTMLRKLGAAYEMKARSLGER
jgi:hypothetical protein